MDSGSLFPNLADVGTYAGGTAVVPAHPGTGTQAAVESSSGVLDLLAGVGSAGVGEAVEMVVHHVMHAESVADEVGLTVFGLTSARFGYRCIRKRLTEDGGHQG